MNVKITPPPASPFPVVQWPPTRHGRGGIGMLADVVRHALLRILLGSLNPNTDDQLGPITRGMTQREVRRREWHAIACAVGDAVEEIAQAFAVVVVCGLGLAALALLVWFAPWWFTVGVFGTAVVALVVWQLALAGRQMRWTVEEIENREQGL